MIKRNYFVKKRKRNWIFRLIVDLVKTFLRIIHNGSFNYSAKESQNKLITTYKNILFSIRNGNEIISKRFIEFSDKKLYEIEYGEYTVPAIIIEDKEEITSNIIFKSGEFISLGIGILDQKLKNIDDYHLLLKLSFLSEDKKDYIKEFMMPVSRGKTLLKTVGSYFRGKEFLDISINAQSLSIPNGKYRLKIFANYKRNSRKAIAVNVPKIAIKSPRLLKSREKNKKILLIGCESLTDPFWLKKIHNLNINLKGFNTLVDDGIYFPNSYSQQDGTLPFMSTMSTGLYSSQHLLGDYTKPIYKHKLHNNLITISEMLSNIGFTTDAITPQGRWDTSYGWARGYDSFKVSKCAWDDSAPNSNNLSNLITKNKNNDSFIFAHIDRMHIPLLQFVPSQSPSINDLNDLNDLNNNNYYPTVFNQIMKLDKVIFDIIQTLKYQDIYDDTLIILTGDHGISIPPNWKSALEFPQYEEHIRVPYIIKNSSWSMNDFSQDKKNINNASIRIFDDIIKSLALKVPKYFSETSQNNKKFENYAFSETIFHPKYNNYGLSVISNDIKYWFNCEMDWENLIIKKIMSERMYIKKSNGEFDENINVVSKNKTIKSNYSEVGESFMKTNLNFYLNNIKKIK